MTDQATYGTNTTRKITVGVVGAITAVAAIFYGISVFEAPIRMKHLSTPAGNPPANYQDYYTKSDGKLYKKNSGGTEAEVGGGSTEIIGVGWSVSNITPGTTFYGIAHNGTNLYVAVGNSITYTSSDGVTWTIQSPAAPFNQTWRAVTYADDLALWVAVASSGTDRVQTSPDGVTWTARTESAVRPWSSICWADELDLLVAVGLGTTSNDAAINSADGVTWNGSIDVPEPTNQWNSVCWSPTNALFCAVSSTGTNRVMTSPDGTTWTVRAAAEANAWTSVTWSTEKGLFVAVASDGTNRVMTSPTGTTWTARSAGTGAYKSVVYSNTNDLFVAVGEDNKTVTSEDGLTWTTSTGAYGSSETDWISLTEFAGVFVTVGSPGVANTQNVMYGLEGNRLPAAIATNLTNVPVNQIGSGTAGAFVDIYNDVRFHASVIRPAIVTGAVNKIGDSGFLWDQGWFSYVITPAIKDTSDAIRISIDAGDSLKIRDSAFTIRFENSTAGGSFFNDATGALLLGIQDTYLEYRRSDFIVGGDTGSLGNIKLLDGTSGFYAKLAVNPAATANQDLVMPPAPATVNGQVLSSLTTGAMAWVGLNPSSFVTSTGAVTLQVGGVTGNTLNLFAGDGTGANVGGVVYIEGGDSAEVTGGHVNIVAGNALGAAGAGGDVFLYAGNSANGLGGSAFLDAGDSTTSTSGNLELGATNAEVVVLGRVTKLISMKGIPALNEAANATSGVATLVAGTVTVSNTSVTANTRFVLTIQDINGGTPGVQYISARNVGTDFTITSNNGADTSIVYYVLIEPAP